MDCHPNPPISQDPAVWAREFIRATEHKMRAEHNTAVGVAFDPAWLQLWFGAALNYHAICSRDVVEEISSDIVPSSPQ